MQAAVPEVLDLNKESAETQKLYGIDSPATAVYGRRLLAASETTVAPWTTDVGMRRVVLVAAPRTTTATRLPCGI